MNHRFAPLTLLCAALASAACGPSASSAPDDASTELAAPAVEHLVILLQENHTFDGYFGLYCAGPTGTPFPSPCQGRGCCERAPQNVAGLDDTWGYPRTCQAYQAPSSYLDDAYNNAGDPTHRANVEYEAMHNSGPTGSIAGTFLMDRYRCHDVKYARFDPSAAAHLYPDVPASDQTYPLRTYHSLAMSGALADRYFQPITGASSSNDMFFSRAAFVFQDNQRGLPFNGYADKTIGDLLDAQRVSWAVYMGGLDAGCPSGSGYPYCADLTDNPFTFSAKYRAGGSVLRDLQQFKADLAAGTLPAVSLLRALGSNSEHAEDGGGGDITAGENNFIKPSIDAINASRYAKKTLILITWDEGGGWFDHVAPPMAFPDGCALPTTPIWSGGKAPAGKNRCALIDASKLSDGTMLPQSAADPEYYSNSSEMAGQEYYGTRVPLIALGPYARKAAGGAISHRTLEHSSIVKFIEWNWLGRKTGQLGTRDKHVNNIGSMLAPALGVPE
jgi:phospholipase C